MIDLYWIFTFTSNSISNRKYRDIKLLPEFVFYSRKRVYYLGAFLKLITVLYIEYCFNIDPCGCIFRIIFVGQNS